MSADDKLSNLLTSLAQTLRTPSGRLALLSAAAAGGITYFALRRLMHNPALGMEDGSSGSGGGSGRGGMRLNAQEKVLEKDFVAASSIDISFEDIGGLGPQIAKVEELVLLPLSHGHLFRHSKVAQQPSGVLLYGPPGTGKTMMAKAIAKTAHANFLSVNVANIESRWFGETPKMVEAIFTLARKRAPCVIFIDEIDGFLSARNESDQQHVNTMKTKFMEMWDGITTPAPVMDAATGEAQTPWVLVIGATNKPWALDPAVQRRMPHQIMVGLPDADARAHILRVILRHEHADPAADVVTVARLCEGYSGSDLREVVRAASLIPIREAYQAEREAMTLHARTGAPLTADDKLEPRAISTQDLLTGCLSVHPTGAQAAMYRHEQALSSATAFTVPHAMSYARAAGGSIPPSSPPPLAVVAAGGAGRSGIGSSSSASTGGGGGGGGGSATGAVPGAHDEIVRALQAMGASSARNSVSISSAVEQRHARLASSPAAAGAGAGAAAATNSSDAPGAASAPVAAP